MIKINSLSHKFGDKVIFDNFDMTLGEGIHALVGRSGAGKTTLLRIIAGLTKADNGEITTDGTVSVSFQENRLFPWYTAKKNVTIVSDNDTAEKILSDLGLYEALFKFPNELSGGMKRRVSLARALAARSNVVLLDEPFAGLDGVTANMTLEVIKEHTRGKTVLISTHNIDIANKLNSIIEI